MRTIFFTWITIFVLQNAFGQFTNKEVIAKIETSQIDDITQIYGNVINTEEVYRTLTYTFTVFITDLSSGKVSKTIKEDRFTLSASEQKQLIQTSIGNDVQEKVVLLLLIYEEDQIIAKDRLAFNEIPKQKESENNLENEETDDGLELKGIVIEETKTKPGKDFFDFFYNSYSFHKINGNKVVGVYEKLSFGRSTIIQVKIEDNMIHEFLGKPDLEYLEQMSKLSIRKVFKYFQDQKKQKNDIFKY